MLKFLCNCEYVYVITCVQSLVNREPRLVVRHSWFTSNCCDIMCIFTFTLHNLHARKKKNNIQKHHVHAFQSFERIQTFLTGKIKNKTKLREIRTYLLYATGQAPKPLHYRGRYFLSAIYIRHFISNNVISSSIRQKLPITDR